MKKLINITGKALSGEWGIDDEEGIGIPVLRTTNFTNDGIIDYSNVITRTITKKNIADKFLRKGDIIIEKSGGSDNQPVGRVVYFDNDENKYLFNNFTGLLRVKDTIKWLPKYIFYSLFANYQSGGTRRYENKTTGLHNLQTDFYVKDFEIKEISYSEQIEICELFDKITDLIDKRKKQLEKLDELVKSRFIEMFGDCDLTAQKKEWKAVREVGTVVGGSTPKTSVAGYWNGEYRWLSPAELEQDSGVIFDSAKKITKAGIESCSLQELPVGTVILSSRAPIGKLAIAGNTFYCNQGFKNIVCSERVVPRYLYSLLLFNTEYLNSLGRGATFKEISKSIVENIKIPVPPIKLQNQFADFVEQIDKSKFEIKQSLEKLELLKKALMQKYFG